MVSARRDSQVQDSVRNLFLGVAPERQQELTEIWERLAPEFQLTPDSDGGERFVMDAGAYRIVRFNHRAVRAFWIAAFAAWEGYAAVLDALAHDRLPQLDRFRILIATFETVISSDAVDEVPLPSGVPEPGHLPDKDQDPQERAAAELAIFAVGWAILHEVRHLQHQQDGTGASTRNYETEACRAEELSCDDHAGRFLLERIDTYARDANFPADKVRQKRQIGIYFALFALTVLAKDKWGATDTHPSVQSRIDAARRLMAGTPSDAADVVAHCAFAALKLLWADAPTPFTLRS